VKSSINTSLALNEHRAFTLQVIALLSIIEILLIFQLLRSFGTPAIREL
jgi:hypothetical protein